MPAVLPGAKVLVTGSNGFIAVWVVRSLLEEGYAVRATVRSLSKGEHLQTIFAKYADKFELAAVEDITKDGAFDEAVRGVDAIEHMASPVSGTADDPQELIVPAVQGTIGILQSALKYGSSVKRIVLTSSVAAIYHIPTTPTAFTEADWDDQAIDLINKQGRDAAGHVKYRASKTLAERAAWEFYEKNKSSVGWDLVALNPPFVYGPAIHSIANIESAGTTVLYFYNNVVVNDKTPEYLATQGGAYVDVRDVAQAHVLSLHKEAAGGERILLVGGLATWQDWLDISNSLTPPPYSKPLPKGNPGAGRNTVHLVTYATNKAEKILGLKYRSLGETARDTLAFYKEKGW